MNSLAGNPTATDPNGYYALSQVPSGEHWLFASVAGAQSDLVRVVVVPGRPVTGNISMVRMMAATADVGFSGIVSNKNGTPAGGATVWILGEPQTVTRTVPSADQGAVGSYNVFTTRREERAKDPNGRLDATIIAVASDRTSWGFVVCDWSSLSTGSCDGGGGGQVAITLDHQASRPQLVPVPPPMPKAVTSSATQGSASSTAPAP